MTIAQSGHAYIHGSLYLASHECCVPVNLKENGLNVFFLIGSLILTILATYFPKRPKPMLEPVSQPLLFTRFAVARSSLKGRHTGIVCHVITRHARGESGVTNRHAASSSSGRADSLWRPCSNSGGPCSDAPVRVPGTPGENVHLPVRPVHQTRYLGYSRYNRHGALGTAGTSDTVRWVRPVHQTRYVRYNWYIRHGTLGTTGTLDTVR